MKDYLTKLCMFLFLAALFSGRTNELGVLTGALTGTPLLAVRTADPASAMAQVSASLCGKTEAACVRLGHHGRHRRTQQGSQRGYCPRVR